MLISKIEEIIALRDIFPFQKKIKTQFNTVNSEEINQIKNGYTNPVSVSKIILARLKFLKQ